jgi:hypothetical protein
LFTNGLSSRNWREQHKIESLSLACYAKRYTGQSEASLLQQVSAIRPKPKTSRWFSMDGRDAEGAYFIAEALRRNGDKRCRIYFAEALAKGFWMPKIWLRSIQAFFNYKST